MDKYKSSHILRRLLSRVVPMKNETLRLRIRLGRSATDEVEPGGHCRCTWDGYVGQGAKSAEQRSIVFGSPLRLGCNRKDRAPMARAETPQMQIGQSVAIRLNCGPHTVRHVPIQVQIKQHSSGVAHEAVGPSDDNGSAKGPPRGPSTSSRESGQIAGRQLPAPKRPRRPKHERRRHACCCRAVPRPAHVHFQRAMNA